MLTAVPSVVIMINTIVMNALLIIHSIMNIMMLEERNIVAFRCVKIIFKKKVKSAIHAGGDKYMTQSNIRVIVIKVITSYKS